MDEKWFVDKAVNDPAVKLFLFGKEEGTLIGQEQYDVLTLTAKEAYAKYCAWVASPKRSERRGGVKLMSKGTPLFTLNKEGVVK